MGTLKFLLLLIAASSLLVSCSFADPLDAELQQILDKLYSKKPKNPTLDHKKTFELLKEAEKYLPGAIKETESFETKKLLELTPRLIKFASPIVDNCNAKYLENYDHILDRIDNAKYVSETDNVARKSLFAIFSKSTGANAYRFVKYYKQKQYDLCAKEFDSRVSKKIKNIRGDDKDILTRLGKKYELWMARTGRPHRSCVSLACQELLSGPAHDHWKTWKNESELAAKPELYEAYFTDKIFNRCDIVNNALEQEYEDYESMERYFKLSKTTEAWMLIAKVCDTIESNKGAILRVCLSNELYDPKVDRDETASETHKPVADWLHATENARAEGLFDKS